MPLEKYFLMCLKNILAIPLQVNMQSVESLSSESPIMYISFMTIIGAKKHPIFLGFSVNCLKKLHIKMRRTNIEYGKDDILLKNFSKEVANLLIKQLRIYIAELDTRTITVSGASICENVGETFYGVTRNFLLDNEDMMASY